MQAKDRMNINIPTRLKRRIKAIADDKDMTMNDVVVVAISDYIDRMDADYASPDYVSERMTEILNSQIRMVQNQNQTNQTLANLSHQIDELQRKDDNHE